MSKDYFADLVEKNIDKLKDHYDVVRTQAQRSFWLSLAVAVTGLTLIICGVVLSMCKADLRLASYIATGSGIITEFIAGVPSHFYTGAVRQLNIYQDSLVEVDNVLLASRLIQGITAERERSATIQKLVESLGRRRQSE